MTHKVTLLWWILVFLLTSSCTYHIDAEPGSEITLEQNQCLIEHERKSKVSIGNQAEVRECIEGNY